MRVIYVLLSLALGGCSLVDQTTFAPSPAEKKPPAPHSVDPRTPLLAISYDTPNPSYQDMLQYAVRAAEARSPGVQYDVYAILPAGGDAAQAQSSAVEVMRAILAQGVPASRVHLGLRTEPAEAVRQVRVYVR
jgi:hypothetical protein